MSSAKLRGVAASAMVGWGDRSVARLLRRMAWLAVLALFLALQLRAAGGGWKALAQTATTPLPAPPAGWPETLELGMFTGPGQAADMRRSAPFRFRYQYLAGGVNTGTGWSTWNADGSFVTAYIEESMRQDMVPVFTYYMLLQSSPGAGQKEPAPLFVNVESAATMWSYFEDLRLFFQRAGSYPEQLVLLHVEPDLWAYMQQRSSGDQASSVPVRVASTLLPELADLPDDLSGFARAIVRLRDAYAPNVLLGYHASSWATGTDVLVSRSPESVVQAAAKRTADFYRSLRTDFDLVFAEFSDRDAGFKQYVYRDGGASWWRDDDFRRHVEFLSTFVQSTQRRVVLWQIPYGNTKMRAVNNTHNHYQDNRVEWLLDDPGRGNLQAYLNAGVIALLFGRGADGVTCACDANNDGVTNPDPINGNTGASTSADDDGGYFRNRAQGYYEAGSMRLPEARASVGPTFTTPAVVPAAARAGEGSGALVASGDRVFAGARVSAASSEGGGAVTLTASVESDQTRSVLVDVEVYGPTGAKVFQKFFDNHLLPGGRATEIVAEWSIPVALQSGAYTVKVGVFGPGWNGLLTWNDAAATVAVTSTTPAPSSGARIDRTTVTAGEVLRLTAWASAERPLAALLDVEIYDPAGAKVFQEVFDNQVLVPGQRREYSVEWPVRLSTRGGTYTVKTGVFGPEWNGLYAWNDAAAVVDVVAAAPTVTASATAVPGLFAAGETVKIRVVAGSSRAFTGLLDVEIYNPVGARVYQRAFEDQALGERSREYVVEWVIPPSALRGTYVVKTGVFESDWKGLLSWNDAAASFIVGPGVPLGIPAGRVP